MEQGVQSGGMRIMGRESSQEGGESWGRESSQEVGELWVKGIEMSKEFSLVEEEVSDSKSFSRESSQWGGNKRMGKEV